MAGEAGIEPATPGFGDPRSTSELHSRCFGRGDTTRTCNFWVGARRFSQLKLHPYERLQRWPTKLVTYLQLETT